MTEFGMKDAIQPKSDQLNADDLISGDRVICIRSVTLKAGEQPVSIFYEGDGGKPWKPCKSMCKVIVFAWGADTAQYIGRSIKLYRDPEVTWAGLAVGGIRISHMSHLPKPLKFPLTASRSVKKLYTVEVLKTGTDTSALDASAREAAGGGMDSLRSFWGSISTENKKLLGGAEYLERLKLIAAQHTEEKATDNESPI